MWITVTEVQVTRGTIALGVGRDAEGHEVTFAGEPRNLRDIEAALEQGEPVLVDVPGWAIMSPDAGPRR